MNKAISALIRSMPRKVNTKNEPRTMNIRTYSNDRCGCGITGLIGGQMLVIAIGAPLTMLYDTASTNWEKARGLDRKSAR